MTRSINNLVPLLGKSESVDLTAARSGCRQSEALKWLLRALRVLVGDSGDP